MGWVPPTATPSIPLSPFDGSGVILAYAPASAKTKSRGFELCLPPGTLVTCLLGPRLDSSALPADPRIRRKATLLYFLPFRERTAVVQRESIWSPLHPLICAAGNWELERRPQESCPPLAHSH